MGRQLSPKCVCVEGWIRSNGGEPLQNTCNAFPFLSITFLSFPFLSSPFPSLPFLSFIFPSLPCLAPARPSVPFSSTRPLAVFPPYIGKQHHAPGRRASEAEPSKWARMTVSSTWSPCCPWTNNFAKLFEITKILVIVFFFFLFFFRQNFSQGIFTFLSFTTKSVKSSQVLSRAAQFKTTLQYIQNSPPQLHLQSHPRSSQYSFQHTPDTPYALPERAVHTASKNVYVPRGNCPVHRVHVNTPCSRRCCVRIR